MKTRHLSIILILFTVMSTNGNFVFAQSPFSLPHESNSSLEQQVQLAQQKVQQNYFEEQKKEYNERDKQNLIAALEIGIPIIAAVIIIPLITRKKRK
ncbi:MAG: hypothetical protein HY222_00565 [Thaumarchaeota archaeon]|nr:hypothetical protein [Nitrososphaerota archaeon]MBI3640879.1 hypothetical protein [Nitrososphaerota archaeon]